MHPSFRRRRSAVGPGASPSSGNVDRQVLEGRYSEHERSAASSTMAAPVATFTGRFCSVLLVQKRFGSPSLTKHTSSEMKRFPRPAPRRCTIVLEAWSRMDLALNRKLQREERPGTFNGRPVMIGLLISSSSAEPSHTGQPSCKQHDAARFAYGRSSSSTAGRDGKDFPIRYRQCHLISGCAIHLTRCASADAGPDGESMEDDVTILQWKERGYAGVGT